VEHRPLGASGIQVSVLALGSWRTYDRISREDGIAVMTAAREAGIDFLDDARYDDETGNAPLATGYSEVVFGELFRAAGWKRDDVVVSNKLWWEFWPQQSATEELDASLSRMQFDYVDLVYAERLPDGLSVEQAVSDVSELIADGKARAWGVLNWPPGQIEAAVDVTIAQGLYEPCAVQLPYSLAHRGVVENDELAAALERAGARVVASAVLAAGLLSGRGRTGRAGAVPDTPIWRRAFEIAERLRLLAAELDTTPACLAIAFALANPLVATVLFGASRPEQVRENSGAVALLERLSDEELSELRALG
jgi:aryl-alcohol dehydrogenase-like predicted oxidoreductase